MPTKSQKRFESEMRDVIENIIDRLEREIQPQLEFPPVNPASQISASSQTTDRAQISNLQMLNEGELKSVYALLAYVAHNENIQQETVQAIVEANFGVNHVAKIQRRSYDEVIRFLVDLRIDEMRN